MRIFTSIDPDVLIAALIKSGHLDKNDKHRLIVHDWSEHSDDAVDNRLARHGLYYADGKQPRMRRMRQEERERVCARFGFLLAKPANFVRTEHHGTPLDTTAHHDGALARSQRPEARSQNPVSRETLERAETLEQRNSGGGESSQNAVRARRNATPAPPPPASLLERYSQSFQIANSFFQTDEKLFVEIVSRALAVVPTLDDSELGKALWSSKKKNQRGAVLWKDTLPEFLSHHQNGQKKAPKKAKYQCATCHDTHEIHRPGLPDHGPKLVAALESGTATIPCPSCGGKT